MKVIEPITVTDANLTSSTIAEDDYPAWDGVTTYAIGDRRIYGHVIYEALTSNTNKQPDQNPLDWLNVGATNRWRMFDAKVGTQSTATTSMTVVVTPGSANAVALVNVDAAYADIVMTDPLAGVVYSRTIRLSSTIISSDWYAYFTDPITARTVFTVTNLPLYPNASISITVRKEACEPVSLGSLVVGMVRQWGIRPIRLSSTIISSDWYAYFTDPITARTVFTVTNLPLYPSASISITVRKEAGETVSLGSLVVGMVRQWGIRPSILTGATTGIQDYSRKERDQFGNLLIVERAFAKRARWGIILTHRDVDAFQARMAAIRAKPAVFIGSDRLDSTVIYGFYRDFSVVISSSRHAECSIELEGLI